MTRFVVATAGHVDHGKSTLVRALTGIEPDRWAEEKRRGLTLDLGFAWMTLPSGREVSFVDVPGHERFIANMLAGLGPAPVVCFVVAADEGWRAQSSEHRDAIAALGIEHGLIVITRADLAPGDTSTVIDQVRAKLADMGLRDAPAVVVSATTGAGLDSFREVLDDVLAGVPEPAVDGRLRLWVDRAFSVTGAGTVVTGTLGSGSIRLGDTLDLVTASGRRSVTVRGLQQHSRQVTDAAPVTRVAINVRGVAADEVARGDVLISPEAWWSSDTVDVGRRTGVGLADAPQRVIAHLGTAAVPARLRPLDAEHGRLSLDRALPLTVGDRLVLRDPGTRRIIGGVAALDVEPPALRRRGAARARAEHLRTSALDVGAEVTRRGFVREEHLRRLGFQGGVPDGILVLGPWWVDPATVVVRARALADAVAARAAADPLSPSLSVGAALAATSLPEPVLLEPVLTAAGLSSDGRYVTATEESTSLGQAESSVAQLEARLAKAPFDAPAADDLAVLGLGAKELAAAERVGRLLRLGGAVVVLPSAPDLALRTLSALDQPFTTSQARQALATSRRVAIPLLEYLDQRGWTRRVDAGHREVVPR